MERKMTEWPRKQTLEAQERFGLKKRTLDVRLAPESGPSTELREFECEFEADAAPPSKTRH